MKKRLQEITKDDVELVVNDIVKLARKNNREHKSRLRDRFVVKSLIETSIRGLFTISMAASIAGVSYNFVKDLLDEQKTVGKPAADKLRKVILRLREQHTADTVRLLVEKKPEATPDQLIRILERENAEFRIPKEASVQLTQNNYYQNAINMIQGGSITDIADGLKELESGMSENAKRLIQFKLNESDTRRGDGSAEGRIVSADDAGDTPEGTVLEARVLPAEPQAEGIS